MSIATAIATGVVKGVDDYSTTMRRQRIEDREDKRFGWEEGDQKQKVKVRDAGTALGESLADIDRRSQSGDLPGGDDNVVQQTPAALPVAPTGIASPSAPMTPPSTPAGAPIVAAAPVATGIRPENAAPSSATPAKQATPVTVFNSNGEGKYKNQPLANEAKMTATRDAWAKFYTDSGQPEKIMGLDKQISEMRETQYEPVRKATAAAIISGDPGAMQMVSKFSKMAGLGVQYEGGTWDAAKRTWNDVKVTRDGGESKVMSIPAEVMFTTIGSLTPSKLIENQDARADKLKDQNVAQQNADSSTSRAASSAVSAGAQATNARLNRDTKRDNDVINTEVKTRSFFASTYGSNKPMKEMTPQEFGMASPDEQARYTRRLNASDNANEQTVRASNLYSLNPERRGAEIVNALAYIDSHPNEEPAGRNRDGSYFFTIGGKNYTIPQR